MKNEPCIRFGMRISPKISEKPAERRNSKPPSARLFTPSVSQSVIGYPPPLSLRHSHICWPSRSLLPLVGRTDSAEGRARRGSPGMEHLADEGLKVLQPQGPGLTDRLGLAPAADARRAGFDREAYARRPPPRSAFGRVGPPPQGGRGIARRLCVNPLAPLRGGVGVGGGGSNSDVRACAR